MASDNKFKLLKGTVIKYHGYPLQLTKSVNVECTSVDCIIDICKCSDYDPEKPLVESDALNSTNMKGTNDGT